jgi:hypothetical protein
MAKMQPSSEELRGTRGRGQLDPLVLARARALLTSSPEGRTAYIPADLRDPAAILGAQATREILDFSRPVALILVVILHFIQDDDNPAEIFAALVDALPQGSFVVASHLTGDMTGRTGPP